MSEATSQRISRELALAAAGANFANLEPWATDRLTAIIEEEDAFAGDALFTEGEPPDHFYFVRQGRVDLVRDGKTLESVEGPRAFGMLDALIERPRSHSAYARGPLQLVRIRVDAWMELLEDSFELARMSVLSLARAVSVLEQRLWSSGQQLLPAPSVGFEVAGERLDVVDRLAVLMCASPLRGAGVQPLSDLATLSDEVVFGAGAHVLERGVPRDRILVLIDGRVEATKESPSVSWRGCAGQVVCGVGAFTEGRVDWDARAVTRTRALTFGVDDWFDVMEENFEMVRATLAALAVEHERLVAAL